MNPYGCRFAQGTLSRKGAPIAGAILGRAIYTGNITPDEAIRAARRRVAV